MEGMVDVGGVRGVGGDGIEEAVVYNWDASRE